MATLENLSTNLINGKAEETKKFTRQALEKGISQGKF